MVVGEEWGDLLWSQCMEGGQGPRSEDRQDRGRQTNCPRKRLFGGREQESTEGEVGTELMNVRLMFLRKWNVVVASPTWPGCSASDPNHRVLQPQAARTPQHGRCWVQV